MQNTRYLGLQGFKFRVASFGLVRSARIRQGTAPKVKITIRILAATWRDEASGLSGCFGLSLLVFGFPLSRWLGQLSNAVILILLVSKTAAAKAKLEDSKPLSLKPEAPLCHRQ